MNPGKVIMGSTIIGIEDIKKILEDSSNNIKKLSQKKEEESHENSTMPSISGNTILTNQRLDHLSKEIADLNESLKFTH